MKLTAMDWIRRANDAALGGGADIRTPEQVWLDWMDSRHMSDWSDDELKRYKDLTGQNEEGQ